MADNPKGGKVNGLPPGGQLFDLQDFGGLNTRSPRQSIEDNEFNWIENYFPIGKGNLRTLNGLGTAAYDGTGTGLNVVYFSFYVLSGVPYMFVCRNDGSALQVNLNTAAHTTITGTFYSGGTLPQTAQWGNQFLLIISSANYTVWDGSVAYTSGALGPQITVTNGGLNYTSVPAVSFTGGSGSGATATAVLTNGSVTAVNITNAGSGYVNGDKVNVIFTGGSPTAGSINTITVTNGGNGYVSAPTVAISGGGGSGATATATVSGGVVSSITVTASGSGFTGTPTIAFTGGGGSGAAAQANIPSVASATASIFPFGLSGTAIETFTARVWIANGNRITFSAPASFLDFSTSDGGGSFQSNESFLKNSYSALKQSDGFLYTFGDSSVNVLSNVSVSSTNGVTTTTFNNQNADPMTGTPWRDTVAPFGEGLTLANTSGVYILYGGSAKKVSDNLDGLFATATLSLTGNGPSTAIATIYGIRVWLMLITAIDPFTGTSRPMMIAYDGKRWFIASQEVNFTYINYQEYQSNLVAYGTDGTKIYPMFQTASATLTKKGKTKLWNGDSYIFAKKGITAYLQAFSNSSSALQMSLIIDTNSASSNVINLSGFGVLQFQNNAGGNITFTNSSNQALQFTTGGITITPNYIDSSFGQMMGYTFTSNSSDFTITAMSLLYKNELFVSGGIS